MVFDPQTGKKVNTDTPLEHPQQVILPTTVDHELQPDALRGSEWVFNHLKDGDGNRITVEDREQIRRDFQTNAVESGAPLRVQNPAILAQEPQRKSGFPIEESEPLRRESQDKPPFNPVPSAPQQTRFDPVTGQSIGSGEPQEQSDVADIPTNSPSSPTV